jgi:hypothetical protein
MYWLDQCSIVFSGTATDPVMRFKVDEIVPGGPYEPGGGHQDRLAPLCCCPLHLPATLTTSRHDSGPRIVGKPLQDALSGFHSARLGAQWCVLRRIDESKHAVIVQDIQRRSAAHRPR